ncbi:leucine-rich repeat-domain-containing protein [Neohortaea acidophila]|uniref:U2 small nuclear ribonucleoprotein A' n=1 Tax=Neohortaea acidophila TaxID=245834 RepID=A0A6A6PTL6_9PEZI|nr:leucine-rich repeat-domain-containing protein [Neohortaea acidophila]KAF2483024.1 leucine-rich repeat-domain-containing protein [Neohortaea acidophila]
MRITAELINNSLSYLNPLKERELDLRGHKIPAIENLGVVAKDHECIDFTDNDISTLANFPLTPRLQTLLLARNRIASIQPNLSKSLPNLRALVLTENHVAELADLDPLQGFAKLTHLSLMGNPVVGKEHYRYYLLWRCPQIRFLDMQKVKDAERKKAVELFGTPDAPTELAKSIAAVRSKGPASFTAASTINGVNRGKKLKITDQEKRRFERAVKQASSLAEVQRLEKALAEGRLPAGVGDEDGMDET